MSSLKLRRMLPELEAGSPLVTVTILNEEDRQKPPRYAKPQE